MNDSSLESRCLDDDNCIQAERIAALIEMSSGVAHYFNNVLMPILCGSDYLLQNPDVMKDRDELLAVVGSIKAVALEARKSMVKLNQFYRDAAGSEKKPVDINRLIESMDFCNSEYWEKEVYARKASVALKTDIRVSLNIPGVESELKEMITCLLQNAVESIVEGGEIVLSVDSKDADKFIEIKVSDNGVAMTDEVRRKCLDPFFSTKPSHLGLGFSLVYGVVRRHAGSLEIESLHGKGTTVTILLPLSRE